MSSSAFIKHNGKVYRIPKVPFEFDEQAVERGWFIINNQLPIATENDVRVALSKSQMYLNEKRLKMKYNIL